MADPQPPGGPNPKPPGISDSIKQPPARASSSQTQTKSSNAASKQLPGPSSSQSGTQGPSKKPSNPASEQSAGPSQSSRQGPARPHKPAPQQSARPAQTSTAGPSRNAGKGGEGAPSTNKAQNTTTSWQGLLDDMGTYFEDVEQIKAWMRSDLFAPSFRKFWNLFYRPTYLQDDSQSKNPSTKSTQPKHSQVLTQLKTMEENNDTKYVRDGGDKVLVAKKPNPIECYAWFVANVTKTNEDDRRGKLRQRRRGQVTRERKWSMVENALRKCIHDQMKGNATTVITRKYLNEDPEEDDNLEQAEIDQLNLEKADGVTFVWRNRDHPLHGLPRPDDASPEYPRDYLHNVPRPFTLKNAWELRNSARDYFDFVACGRWIAKAYTLENDPVDIGGMYKHNFTQQKWENIRGHMPNTRGRIFVIIETADDESYGLPVYEDHDSVDLPDFDISGEWDTSHDSNRFDYDRFVTPTLELIGRACQEYEEMKEEREDDEDLEPGFHHRMDQYEALLALALRTNGRTDGDVTNKHAIAGKLKGKKIDQANAFDYSKEQEDLGKALENNRDNMYDDTIIEHISNIGDNVFSRDVKEKEREMFEEAQKWTDNKKFQRENEEEANELLGITDPNNLIVPGMGTTLKFWQPVAAAAIYQFLWTAAAVAFLLDTVGLGKTIEILAVIQTRWNRMDAVPTVRARMQQFGHYRPILLVVPANLMPQWLNEIMKHLPKANIKIYHPDFPTRKKIQDERVEYYGKSFVLQSTNELFNPILASGRTIVITSPTVFANRHGPRALEKWRAKEGLLPSGLTAEEDREAMFKVLEPKWPSNLSNLFSLIICDEGHFAKHGMRVLIGVTLEWLRQWPKPTPIVFMTATPMPAGVGDLPGYFEITERTSGRWTKAMMDAAAKAIKSPVGLEDNPYHMPDCEEVAALRQSTYAIRKYISKNGDPVEQGANIEKLLMTCAIKRGHASRIPFDTGPKIDSELPAKLHKVIKLKFTKDEYPKHRELHNIALNELAFKLKHAPEGGQKVVFDMTKLRILALMTTSTRFSYLTEKTLNRIDELRKLVDTGAWDLRDFAELICEDARQKSVDMDPPGDSIEELLGWFADGSPKVRYMSWILAEVVVKLREKLLIYCGGPWQQLFWTLFVKAMQISCNSFHAGLSPAQRADLTDSLNSASQDSVQVMVVTYAVGGSGYNWHYNCFDLVKTDPANSDDQDVQAIGRIYRILQKNNCRIFDLIVERSWNVWQVANSSNKSLAQLMACLNTEYFSKSVEDGGYGNQELDDAGNIIHKGANFETFVREGGQLVKLSAASGKGEKKPLTGVNLIREMRDILYGSGETTSWTKARGRMFLEPDDAALTSLLPLPEDQDDRLELPKLDS